MSSFFEITSMRVKLTQELEIFHVTVVRESPSNSIRAIPGDHPATRGKTQQ